MLPILVLLGILYISYRQTIRAYPSNGGAYTVSKENLGTNASLLAAAALTIDYILNVAVGISAGVAALTSAFPSLHPYTLWLCLAILVLVTSSTCEARLTPAEPGRCRTYLFIASVWAKTAGVLMVLLGAGLELAAVWLWSRDQLGRIRTNKSRCAGWGRV
jgi:amino acid transporter